MLNVGPTLKVQCRVDRFVKNCNQCTQGTNTSLLEELIKNDHHWNREGNKQD